MTKESSDQAPIPLASSSALDILLGLAVHDEVLPDDIDLVAAIAQFCIQTAASINKLPNKKYTLKEMYSKLMEMFMEMTVSEACAQIGISRSKFYWQRSIFFIEIVSNVKRYNNE